MRPPSPLSSGFGRLPRALSATAQPAILRTFFGLGKRPKLPAGKAVLSLF
jgi:hypothetical protein